MKNGFDANQDLTKYGSSLLKNNYQFVVRYYNINNPSKNLSLAEAHYLSNAGLGIVAIWENSYPTSSTYFSYDIGVHDGTSAYYYANKQIGQPLGSPIYFAVDYDASEDDVNKLVSAYFQGIKDGFNTISGGNPLYSIGVYGSGLVCSMLLEKNLVSFTWLAQSMGWRLSKTFTNYNLRQSLQKTECIEIGGGVIGDPNESPNDQEGSFLINVS